MTASEIPGFFLDFFKSSQKVPENAKDPDHFGNFAKVPGKILKILTIPESGLSNRNTASRILFSSYGAADSLADGSPSMLKERGN